MTAIDLRRLSIALTLGWLCALSPFAVLFVIGTAWLEQQSAWRSAFGAFADPYREVMLSLLHGGWTLSMVFAVYIAGPLWLLSLWLLLIRERRWRSSWTGPMMQVITCAVGWALVWLLIIRSDLLSKLG